MKLLRGHLAVRGLSCGMALVTSLKVRQISTVSSALRVRSDFVWNWGGLKEFAIVLI